MNVLEKILEEIENRESYHEELLFQRDNYEMQKMYCTEELGWVKEIIRFHMDEAINDDWIDCQKVMPGQDMDKKPVWIVYGSPMNLSVKFAYCSWTLSEDEYGNDDSYTQFYIPQAPCLYYPSPNLVHYWKAINIPKFQEDKIEKR